MAVIAATRSHPRWDPSMTRYLQRRPSLSIGSAVFLGLVLVSTCVFSVPAAEGPPESGLTVTPIPEGKNIPHLMTAGDLIGFSRELGDGVQAITLINASQRWMAVYHIDSSGEIRLTGSRPLADDFTIQFNATSPLPEEIRRLRGK